MKALKTITLGGALGAAIALSTPTYADDARDYRRSSLDIGRVVVRVNDRSYADTRNYRDFRYNQSRRHVDSRDRRRGPITVRLNYDANGDGQIRLRRLLRNQHGIDTSDWRIRSVNVRHKSRRVACADLTVGGRSTGPVNLRRGITTLHAPRGHQDGRWVLGFENAKVRDVAVVLEPVRNGRRELAFNARVR